MSRLRSTPRTGVARLGLRLGLLSTLGLLAAVPTTGAAQETSSPPASGIAVVLAASLNVRAGPGLDRAVVGSVQRGDTVCVVGREPDWLRVRLPTALALRDAQGGGQPALSGYAARGFLAERRLPAGQLRQAGCGH